MTYLRLEIKDIKQPLEEEVQWAKNEKCNFHES